LLQGLTGSCGATSLEILKLQQTRKQQLLTQRCSDKKRLLERNFYLTSLFSMSLLKVHTLLSVFARTPCLYFFWHVRNDKLQKYDY